MAVEPLDEEKDTTDTTRKSINNKNHNLSDSTITQFRSQE